MMFYRNNYFNLKSWEDKINLILTSNVYIHFDALITFFWFYSII